MRRFAATFRQLANRSIDSACRVDRLGYAAGQNATALSGGNSVCLTASYVRRERGITLQAGLCENARSLHFQLCSSDLTEWRGEEAVERKPTLEIA